MVRLAVVALAQHGEQVGHDQQRGRRCEQQAADHGARQRGVLLLAGAADRHRDHADDHRRRRHQHRTDSGVAGSSSQPRRPTCPASCCSRAKVTSRIEFAEATPTAMIAPISEGTLSVVPVMNSIVTMPQKRRRQRQDHDERIAEVLIVHDHQQIDEHRGEQQADAEIAESVVHALDLSDHLNRIAGLELLLQLGDDLVDVGCDAAEIAALHAGIDLIDRLDVGLVGVGRRSSRA